MAIVVEDGTGKADAVAFITVAFADAYHAARGRTDWTALSDANCELAIVRATDYIELRFGSRFRGSKITQGQALSWPRLDAYDNSGNLMYGSDAVPRQLQKACAEYALIASRVGELAPNPAPINGTQAVATGVVTASSQVSGLISRKRTTVGPIDKDVSYVRQGNQVYRMGTNALISSFNIPEYPLADMWLAELIGSSTTADIGRA